MAIYRSADYRSLQVTTGHYGHYRFRGKVPWFADVGRLIHRTQSTSSRLKIYGRLVDIKPQLEVHRID